LRRRLIRLRKEHPVLHRATFFQGRAIHGAAVKDIEWYRPDGQLMQDGEWSDGYVRSVGMLLNGQLMDEVDAYGRPLRDDVLLLLLNAHHEPVVCTLPGAPGGPVWTLLLDTAQPDTDGSVALAVGAQYELAGRSLTLLCQSGEAWSAQFGRTEAPAVGPVLAPLLGGPAPEQRTVSGTVVTLAMFHSPQLDTQRDLLIYLPPSYDTSTTRYPVIYAHDGQNLFDEATSVGGEWQVDEAMETLARRGVEAIVVGISHLEPRRIAEYSPFVDATHGGGQGDAYVAFITDTVKPYIDRSFRTQPEPAQTAIMGAGLGGLISLYGQVRRPDVFGIAVALSPVLGFAEGAIFDVVEQAPAAPGRIYLDVGTDEGDETLVHTRRMRDLILAKGAIPGRQLGYREAAGGSATAATWAARVSAALSWTLTAAATA
jgi:glycogen operon protein